jgi:CubicO group peptidase (beta-lactamase class C family)
MKKFLILMLVVGSVQASLSTHPSCQKLNDLIIAKKEKDSPQTRMVNNSFIVYKEGQTLFEQHNAPFKANDIQCLWSSSKSMTALMVGRAISEGKLSAEDYLHKYFPFKKTSSNREKDRTNYELIQIKHLLEQTAGFKWYEHEDKGFDKADSIHLLYGVGAWNTLEYALSRPMSKSLPGREWNYSSGNYVILSGVLQKIYGHHFAHKLLFDPLKMKKATLEIDPSGNALGSSLIHMSARDMLKVGVMLLNQGKHEGKTYLDSTWLKTALTRSKSFEMKETDAKWVNEYWKGTYGFSLWLNQGVKERGIDVPFPNSPSNMFFTAGHFGQLIVVLPTEKMVIIRTGHDLTYWDKIDEMVKLTKECFE